MGMGRFRARLKRRVALASIALIVYAACSNASFVERITFVNDGDFPAHVEVIDSTRSGWLGLGIARDKTETSFEEVIDQGEVWIFRLDYAGKHHQDLEISRSDLVQDDWTVEVPAEFETSLRALGLSPPP